MSTCNRQYRDPDKEPQTLLHTLLTHSATAVIISIKVLRVTKPAGTCRFASSDREALQFIWLAFRLLIFFLLGIIDGAYSIVLLANSPRYRATAQYGGDLMYMAASLLVPLFSTARVRRRCRQVIIERVLERDANLNGEIMQAATVAALVGRVGVQRACELACKNFRSLSFATLTPEDLSSNKDTGLFQRTRLARLGQVDVFFSHSWSDSPSHKWAALQQWCVVRAYTLHSVHSSALCTLLTVCVCVVQVRELLDE